MIELQAPPEKSIANRVGWSELHDGNKKCNFIKLNYLPKTIINITNYTREQINKQTNK